MNMMPFVYGWVVLVVVVLSLAIGRYRVARHDNQMLHLTDKAGALLTQQAVVERKLRRIDFWGQWLTVIAVLYGLTLLDIYFQGVWVAEAKPPG